MTDHTEMTQDQFEKNCKRLGLKWWPEFRGDHERPRCRIAGQLFGPCVDATTGRTMLRETFEMWLGLHAKLTEPSVRAA